MPSRRELHAQWCVDDLIHVVEEVPVRAAARAPMPINGPTTAMLLLWSLLRWERTFVLLELEKLGVDMWKLTCDVDGLLNQCQTAARSEAAGPAEPDSPARLDRFVRAWLSHATEQARAFGHAHLGAEHLLLAILARPSEMLAPLLAAHGLDYVRVKGAILAALDVKPGEVPIVLVESEGAGDSPSSPDEAPDEVSGVGVPRRFGMGVLLLIVTLYALLFSLMQALQARPAIFVLVAVFVTGVGVAQAVFFGGKRPRVASFWAGAVLAPVELLIGLKYLEHFSGTASWTVQAIEIVCLLLLGIPAGVVLGYAAGILIAGSFCLIDRYHRSQGEGQDT